MFCQDTSSLPGEVAGGLPGAKAGGVPRAVAVVLPGDACQVQQGQGQVSAGLRSLYSRSGTKGCLVVQGSQ